MAILAKKKQIHKKVYTKFHRLLTLLLGPPSSELALSGKLCRELSRIPNL
uniref:Uncharacterized protein n=1 Tax=Vitis vinifera TaxID=29760 RepID=F6HX61_VITVI